jgi:hypothetical protein
MNLSKIENQGADVSNSCLALVQQEPPLFSMAQQIAEFADWL